MSFHRTDTTNVFTSTLAQISGVNNQQDAPTLTFSLKLSLYVIIDWNSYEVIDIPPTLWLNKSSFPSPAHRSPPAATCPAPLQACLHPPTQAAPVALMLTQHMSNLIKMTNKNREIKVENGE